MNSAMLCAATVAVGLLALISVVRRIISECREAESKPRGLILFGTVSAAVMLLLLSTLFAGSKWEDEQPVDLPAQWWQAADGDSVSGSQTLAPGPNLTEDQYEAGFALVGVSTNASPWPDVPSNAGQHEPWTRFGLADDTFWLPADGWSFTLGTNAADGVQVSSDGTLSFWRTKGSPRAVEMPDSYGISFLAPLQGPLGTVPPEGRFWHAPTSSNSVLFTWQRVFAGRETNSPVTFQAELFANGDFVYRYAFTNALALTNFVVGAQHCNGGETYALNDTNKLVNGLELRWRAFGILDPNVADHDGDGLSTYDEVMTYATSPSMPDTDLDGMGDLAEVVSLANPRMRDSDGDGMPDGSDPHPTTADSSADSDGDGLPDVWETYWFGSTNVTGGADADANGNGADNLGDLLTGVDPAFAACAVTTSHGVHLFTWTALSDATNYTASVTLGNETVWSCVTNGSSLSVTGDFTSAEHALSVTAHCTNAIASHNASATFRQPSRPNLTVWKIAAPFALDPPSNNAVVTERTFRIGRTGEWQQFFVSASHDAAAPWSLEGLRLEWSDNIGASGWATASPAGDSLALAVAPDAQTLTVRLVATQSGGLSRSPKTLNLLGWSPTVALDTNAAFVATDSGPVLVSVTALDGSATGLGFAVDTAGRPHNAAMSQQETDALLAPFGTEGVPFTGTYAGGLLTGGTFNAGAPGAYASAAPGGGGGDGGGAGGGGGSQPGPTRPGPGPFTHYLIAPSVSHERGTETCGCLEDGSDSYPIDTSCLLSAWRNSGGCWTEESPGFSFSLGSGVPDGLFTVTVNSETFTDASLAYAWAGEERSAHIGVKLGEETVWSATAEREPDVPGMPCADTAWGGGDCGSCGGCESGDCSAAEGDSPGSVRFRLPLGFTGYKQMAGFVWFHMETQQAVTASLFRVTADEYTVTRRDANGMLTNAVRYGPGGRDIRIGPAGGGVIVSVRDTGDADPDRTWTIAEDEGAIRFVKKDGAGNTLRDVSYRQTWAGYGQWTRTDNATGLVETRNRYGNVTNDTETTDTEIRDASGLMLEGSMIWRTLIGAGPAAAVREIRRDDWDGFAWRYTYMTYWADSLNPLLNGCPKFRHDDSGDWEYRAYDTRGREILRADPLDGSGHPFFKDYAAPFTFSPSGSYASFTGLVTVTSYTPAQGDGDALNDSRKPRQTSRYAVRGGTPKLVSREWQVYTRGTAGDYPTVTRRVIRAGSAASGTNDAANAQSLTVSYSEDDDTVAVLLRGRPLREEREDGTLLTWEYAVDAGTLTITEKSGTVALPEGIVNVSTYGVETLDAVFGRTLSRQTRLYTGGAGGSLLASETREYDSQDRLVSTAYSDGTAETNVWGCCRLEANIGRDGTRTDYGAIPGNDHWSITGDSSLGGLPGANGLYPAVEKFTDALDRETNSVLRVYSGVNPANDPSCPDLSTRTEYPYGTGHYTVKTDPLGVQTVSRRYFGSNCEVSENASGGVTNRTTQVWGGAVIEEKYWDGKWTRMTRAASHTASGCRVETVTAEASDMPVPVVTFEKAYDFLGREVSVTTPLNVTSNFYENGRLVRVSRTGSPDTLYVYDDVGNVTATALDVDADAQVSYAGSDRISATETRYEADASNVWWRVTSWAVWSQAGADSWLTSSVTRVRMTGLGGAAPSWLSANAILTAQNETVDGHGNARLNSTCIDAGSASVWQVTESPFSTQAVIRVSKAGTPLTNISASCVTNTYAYDGFARQITVTDGRGNASRTAYNSFGQTEYTEDAASNRTAYAYDELGRQASVSSPLSNTVFTAYDSLGNVIRTWGATYPVEYGYDTQGRKISMKTFRVENGNGDETRWIYNNVTGLLTNKVYADGKGTAYGYTTSGRLASRTWARGVTTSYAYDVMGQLTGINYSDSTPDVTLAYDRLGRMTSATTPVSTNLFEYSGFDLVTETQNGVTVTRSYDSLGRSAGFNMGSSYIAAYGYDTFGRFAAVSSSVAMASSVASYSYVAGADLVASMTNSAGFSWARVYEQKRDLILSVKNAFAANPVSAYDYANDADGRRTLRIDSTPALSVTNAFDYNEKAEVTNALMGEISYGYAYDDIGNRQTSSAVAVSSSYTANNLNQYTAIAGAMACSPIYDLDGNMTGDGKNANSWDGENRLIRSEPGGIATNGAVLVENNYDYQNRRFKKTVKRLSGRGAGYPMDPSQPGSWNVIETRKYIWDTWNIAAEIVIDDSAGTTNINYNTWGLDLSGSIQGAGGVGGLLAVTKASSSATNAYFAGTDANGNVTAYVDGGGTAVAHYAYSAFGETTAKSGSMADDFTHRFSTKPFDVETGYSKYQQRDYIPPLARWASRDPIEEKGGLNLYCANANDYINGIDLFGWTGLDFSKLPSTCGKCSIKYMEEQGVGGGLTQPARILLGYPNYSQCKCADQQARFRQTYPNSTCSVDVQLDQSPDTMLPGIGITLIAHENKHVKCAADAYDWVLEQIFSKVSKSCCGMDKSDIGKKLANLIVAAAGFKRVACSMEIDYIDYQKSTLKANLDQVTSKQQNAIKAQQSFEEYLIKIDAAAKKWENCQ